jgi:hypothetical protein
MGARLLTDRVAVWVDAHVTGVRLSDAVQEIAARYAPPPLPAARIARYREGTLMVAHGLATLAFTLLAAVALALSRSDVVKLVGIAAVVFCIMGTVLHTARLYDAQLAIWRHREDAARRWPRASGDADFVAQLVVGVLVAALIV